MSSIIDKLHKIQEKVNEQSKLLSLSEETKRKLLSLDSELKNILGMIEFIYQSSQGKKILEDGTIEYDLQKTRDMIENIVNKNYSETTDKLYLEKPSRGETWKVIGDLFSAFVKTQKELDEISKKTTYDDALKNIGINIDGCLVILLEFSSIIDKILNHINETIKNIKKSVFDDY